MNKSGNQKGETKLYFIVIGALIAIVVFAAIKYYQDRDNDITIHVPKIEVR